MSSVFREKTVKGETTQVLPLYTLTITVSTFPTNRSREYVKSLLVIIYTQGGEVLGIHSHKDCAVGTDTGYLLWSDTTNVHTHIPHTTPTTAQRRHCNHILQMRKQEGIDPTVGYRHRLATLNAKVKVQSEFSDQQQSTTLLLT